MRNNSNKIKDILIPITGNIQDAMISINNSGRGICFVTKKTKNEIIGVLTDGDIRRLLLQGFNKKSKLEEINFKSYEFLKEGYSNTEAQKKLTNYRILPVLNNLNEVTDFVSSDRIRKIPLINTSFKGKELEYLTDCIETGWVSSIGSYVSHFEKKFSEYVDVSHALCVSSGTTGLQIALRTLGIGEGDEVIIPNLTFAATINAVLHVGARPILVDIDKATFCLDSKIVKKFITKKTKCILLVHLYGNSCDLDNFYNLRDEYNLKIIEDCAEALGTKFMDYHVGKYADASVYSFFGNKLITTGEGGMVCFNNKKYFELAKILISHGMNPIKKYWHDEVGYNFRMTNIQAALGLAQLEQIDSFLYNKKLIGDKYTYFLKDEKRIKIQKINPKIKSSYWLFVIILNENFIIFRDKIMKMLLYEGIETRPVFYPLHEMKPYKQYSSNEILNTTKISYGGICLPTGIGMKTENIKYICKKLSDIINTINC